LNFSCHDKLSASDLRIIHAATDNNRHICYRVAVTPISCFRSSEQHQIRQGKHYPAPVVSDTSSYLHLFAKSFQRIGWMKTSRKRIFLTKK
jgi:hypothetical protein